METKELMIDNLVEHNNYISRIAEISESSNRVVLDNPRYTALTDYVYNLKPVPITKEFLAKNFKVDEHYDDVYYLKDGLYILLDTDDGGYVLCNTFDVGYGKEFNYIMTISYIHELQQFLRLIKYHKKINF